MITDEGQWTGIAERKLWAAVVEQAIKDATMTAESQTNIIERDIARHWFTAGGYWGKERDKVFSNAGLDVEAANEWAQKMQRIGWPRDKERWPRLML